MSSISNTNLPESASPSWLRVLSSWGNGFFFVVVLLFLVFSNFHRYPTDREVMLRLGVTDSEKASIKESEGEIGAYHVIIERDGKSEELIVETYAQWVLPGQSYDWDIYDDLDS
ncbi:MAG: hypothetical protein OJI67_03990 [Prosthecobacter sp.]|nr:hypothetical protein [Prosthecobacter sp.]